MKRLSLRLVVCMLLILPVALFQLGCGSSSGGRANAVGTGAASLNITWPGRAARLIPTASNSIRFVFRQAGVILADQLVPRPALGGASTVTVHNLANGTVQMTATAYPTADGTGTPQATGVTNITILDDQTTTVNINMDSTIDHLEVAPSPLNKVVGMDTSLVVTAKDAAGAMVLITPGKVTYQPSTAAVTVDATGLAHAAAPGSGQITITETESGKVVTDQYTITALQVAGSIYIADTGPNGHVKAVGTDLAQLSDIGTDVVAYPSGVAVDTSGNLYTGVFGNGAGRTIRKFNAAGVDQGLFATLPAAPVSMRFAPSGSLIVLAQINGNTFSLYSVSANGVNVNLLTTINQLSREMTLDSAGNIYVSIYGFTNNILKFSPGGAAQGVFVSVEGTYPSGIAFDSAGNFYAAGFADQYGDTIQKYTSAGTRIGTFASGISGAWGLTFDPNGNLYVSGYVDRKIHKFSPTGTALGTSNDLGGFLSAIAFGPPASNLN
jgi:streptogramin lyase